MSSEYRGSDGAAREKIIALEAELRDREAKLSKLLFSRTPAGAFSPARARSVDARPVPARSDQEAEFNVVFAFVVGFACALLGAGPIVSLGFGAIAYFAFRFMGAGLRALVARARTSPTVERRPEDIAELAAVVSERNAQIESLAARIAGERAACEDLRKQIDEAALLANDEATRRRESSR